MKSSPNQKGNMQDAAFELLAKEIEKAGLRLEDNFRVSDSGMAFTHAGAAAIARTGFPMPIEGNDSLETMGISRTGGYWHPLAEMKPEDECGVPGGLLNLWASTSLMVNHAMGWTSEPSNEKSISFVKKAICLASPTTSADVLMYRARYSDFDLLRMLNLVHEHLETTAKANAK